MVKTLSFCIVALLFACSNKSKQAPVLFYIPKEQKELIADGYQIPYVQTKEFGKIKFDGTLYKNIKDTIVTFTFKNQILLEKHLEFRKAKFDTSILYKNLQNLGFVRITSNSSPFLRFENLDRTIRYSAYYNRGSYFLIQKFQEATSY